MKFKVNDRVVVIKEGTHCQNIGDIGIIEKVDFSFYFVRMKKDNDIWCFSEDEITLDEIKVGDLVEINEYSTIDDFTKNHWNGCKNTTLDFISNFAGEGVTFTVTEKHYDYLMLKETSEPININIFKKVDIKKMTKEEIEKKLGYKIKII